MEKNKDNEEMFRKLLANTKREGIGAVLKGLEEEGFFTSPASSQFHGSYEGGLCEHSLNVYRQAMAIYEAELKLDPEKVKGVTGDNIAIAALLHDVCKMGVYKTINKWRKDANGRWEQYLAYGVDYSDAPLGHGEKSVIWLLRRGLKLTDAEILAIRWHMTKFDLSDSREAQGCFAAAVAKSALVPIIATADQLSTWITESAPAQKVS